MPKPTNQNWFAKHAPDAILFVAGRLARYPSLRAFREKVSREAVDRAESIFHYLEQNGGYFADLSNDYARRRWQRTVAFREALRVLLHLEWIETALDQLPAEVRVLFRWMYVDQFSDDDIARLLNLQTNDCRLFNVDEACRRMIDAYEQICRVIAHRFPSENFVPYGKYFDPSLVFPTPPNICCDCGPIVEKGGLV